jgi:hypothetical protein
MNGLCWPSGLAPWRGVLVGVWGCAHQPLRTASQSPLRRWGSSILSLTVLGHWDMTPGSWQAALACWTRLWWPCCLCKEPTQKRWDSVGMSLTYRLERTWETTPLWVTPAWMPQHVNVADWKDAGGKKWFLQGMRGN